ncbi:MAG: shikimate dehydrogenase [Alphaproteobacteria bacterium]
MSKIDESAAPPMPWVDGNSRVFGVIAHPVTHVRAPMVFNPRFAAAGLDHIMVPIDAPPDSLEDIIRGLQRMPNFGGLAVTIPHKLAMAELCDDLGTVARLTGAVNAVRFDPDGRLYGDNFDGAGFVAGCRGNGFEVTGKTVLMLGAGGAARAIAAALCEAGVGQLTIANRNLANAQQLVDLLVTDGGFANVSAQPLAETDGAGVDMIINSTSLGLHADDPVPLALNQVSKNTVIADIIMVPAETKWLQDAKQRGFAIHYGRHMLDYQIDLIGRFIGAF